MLSLPALIGEGFIMGVILWIFFWGMTVPIRFLFRMLGIGERG